MYSHDPRISELLRVLSEHVSSPSLQHIRDHKQLHRTAERILRRLDGKSDPWRKWPTAREKLLVAAAECWIPLTDLHAALCELPGPPLTDSDVSARLIALWDDYHSKPDEASRAGCEAFYDREKAAGTEMAAIVVLMAQYVADEAERVRVLESEQRRARKEANAAELRETLLSGADCSWTTLDERTVAYCRVNGRLYRLTRAEDKKLEMERLTTVEDGSGRHIGRYQSRGDATKALERAAFMPEPRR